MGKTKAPVQAVPAKSDALTIRAKARHAARADRLAAKFARRRASGKLSSAQVRKANRANNNWSLERARLTKAKIDHNAVCICKGEEHSTRAELMPFYVKKEAVVAVA